MLPIIKGLTAEFRASGGLRAQNVAAAAQPSRRSTYPVTAMMMIIGTVTRIDGRPFGKFENYLTLPAVVAWRLKRFPERNAEI